MPLISAGQLGDYRRQTFHLDPNLRLGSREEALAFVNQRGFIYFWPIKGVEMPNLWTAVAGQRAVADAHDDPGHVTWGWKDDLLDKRQWYYAKVLRGKATIISLDIAPTFYALSENYGDPQQDYLDLYEDGLLSREAKTIYEVLLHEGPLDTVNMRRMIHMTGKASNSPFERSLVALQRDFKILPVGIDQAGAWRYSFIYDLVQRYYPDLPQKARPITRQAARQGLLSLYFDSLGAATISDVHKLFQWRPADTHRALEALIDAGVIKPGFELEGRSGEHFVISNLLSG